MKANPPRGPGVPAAWPGYLAALGAAALWALSATLAKSLFTAALPPLAMAQTRALVGFLVLWPILFLVRRPLTRLPRRDLAFVVLFGLNFTFLHATYYYAVARLPVAVAILVQDLAPLFILAYVGCWMRRPVGRGVWGAALLCVAGCSLVAGVWGHAGSIHLDGLLVGMVSAVNFALYVLLAEEGARRLSPWTLLCYGLGFAALFWTFLRPWWLFPFQELTPQAGALILFIGVAGTLAPFALLFIALRHVPAGIAGITTTAEPVVAAGLAYLLLHEKLTPMQGVGGGLVLAGILLAQAAYARMLSSRARAADNSTECLPGSGVPATSGAGATGEGAAALPGPSSCAP